MELLLDTQIFFWFVEGDPHLPDRYRPAIESPSNRLYLSIGSLWEITIKSSLGKLTPKNSIEKLAKSPLFRNSITILPIRIPDLIQLQNLPHHHRDPFDRIIVSQAIAEGFTVLTTDPQFEKYPVRPLK